MKAVMVMFDSLNRNFLSAYGCDWVHAPNFERLYHHTIAFDNCYAGSLPCMPARREIHTGRYNFLHNGWGPLEPFDDSVPEMLSKAGIYTHLISDHCHYWEDGGATYHTRYSTWESVRGQEGDHWKADLNPDIVGNTFIPASNPMINKFKSPKYRQDAVNRNYRPDMEHSCQKELFDRGLDFLETNAKYDNWFLQIESFDPHEPFYTFEEYTKIYKVPEINHVIDWPPYDKVHETAEEVEYMRNRYAAMISMCDTQLGRILDFFDEHDLWKDTMLIVNTDHGFLLGEHGWWAKNAMPCWDEIVHLPLFIWDPRSECCEEHRQSLVQTIDIAPTLLNFFGLLPTKDMQGRDLAKVIERDEKIRDYALFGYHGCHVNITDGRYVYMRSVEKSDIPYYAYTLMPCDMAKRKGKELEEASLFPPFSFTKNMPVLKIPSFSYTDGGSREYGTLLYDLENDRSQNHPLTDADVEQRFVDAMKSLMIDSEAPMEVFERLGLQV